MESPRGQHYGIWMAAVVTLVLLGVYVGALVVLSHSQKILAVQEGELAGEVQREESMHTLSGLLNDLSGETMKLNAFFVSPDGGVGVIEGIEALSSVVGVSVTVSDVHIKNNDDTTGEGILSMNVSASGSWRSITHLLVLLDALPFQSELTSVALTLVGAGDEDVDAQWTLRGLLEISLRR